LIDRIPINAAYDSGILIILFLERAALRQFYLVRNICCVFVLGGLLLSGAAGFALGQASAGPNVGARDGKALRTIGFMTG
jgi:hypothetical protein